MNLPDLKGSRPLILESLIILVNVVLGIAFYGAEMNLRDGHFLKNNLTVLAERGFYFGVVMLIVLVVARLGIKDFLSRLLFLISVTLFNQACLIALFASAIPFKLG